MIKMNLLPQELRPSRWSYLRVTMMVTVLITLSFLGITGYNAWTIQNLEFELKEMEVQSRLLQPARTDMLRTLDSQRELSGKIINMAQIAAERRSWYGVMAYVGLATPVQIVLKEVLANDSKQLLLRGTAESYGDLAAFLRRLEQEGFFESPVLIKVENDGLQEGTTFELSVKLKEI